METLTMPSKTNELPFVPLDDKATNTLPTISSQCLLKGGASPSLVSATPGIELPKLVGVSHATESVTDSIEKRKPKPITNLTRYSPRKHSLTSQSLEYEKPQKFNPNPMPYQSSSFKSSTMVKKVPVLRRHGDTWGGNDTAFHKAKGVIFHSDRYQWDDFKQDPYDYGQREPQQTHFHYIEQIRGTKRKRDLIPHRARYDLHMGGQKVLLSEREDITTELMRLKSVVLPTRAKDLYVGRGFHFSQAHAVNKPRPVLFPPEGRRVSNKPALSQSKVYSPMENKWVTPKRLPEKIVTKEKETVKVEPTSDTEGQPDDTGRESELDIVFPEQEDDVVPPLEESPRKSVSPRKTATPNPLKGIANKNIEDDQLNKLRETFERLDTDMDGHVMFHQLKSQLPSEISHTEERFIKQVYDITSASTFFGLDEFISLTVLCQSICKLSGAVRGSYQKIDFSMLENTIIKYIDLFQSLDRQSTGKISIESLEGILSSVSERDLKEEKKTFQQVKYDLGKTDIDDIKKLEYLAFLPYFMSLPQNEITSQEDTILKTDAAEQ